MVIEEMWLAEIPTKKIAKKLKVSDQTIRNTAKRLRLPERNHRGELIDRAIAGSPASSVVADAVSALVNLGYKRPKASDAVRLASLQLDETATAEALIAAALKELGPKPQPPAPLKPASAPQPGEAKTLKELLRYLSRDIGFVVVGPDDDGHYCVEKRKGLDAQGVLAVANDRRRSQGEPPFTLVEG